jgi:hypothetical protein
MARPECHPSSTVLSAPTGIALPAESLRRSVPDRAYDFENLSHKRGQPRADPA